MNIKKFIKCCCLTSLLIVSFCVIIILLPEKTLEYSEMKSIKSVIKNNNYDSIGFKGVTKGKYNGYKFEFEIYDRSSDDTLDEALDCYIKILNHISENDLSINNKVISFNLREKNDSGFGTIEISNYCEQTDSFDFKSVRYIRVYCCLCDLSPLERCSGTLNYLSISDISNAKMADFSSFTELKEIAISNCTDDKGNIVSSDSIVNKLKE